MSVHARSARCYGWLLLVLISGCTRLHGPETAVAVAVRLVVLNPAVMARKIELRVDGTQIGDTIAQPAVAPPVSFTRDLKLTPGQHRLEFHDRERSDDQTLLFDVRPGPVTLEVWVNEPRAKLRVLYIRMLYM